MPLSFHYYRGTPLYPVFAPAWLLLRAFLFPAADDLRVPHNAVVLALIRRGLHALHVRKALQLRFYLLLVRVHRGALSPRDME